MSLQSGSMELYKFLSFNDSSIGMDFAFNQTSNFNPKGTNSILFCSLIKEQLCKTDSGAKCFCKNDFYGRRELPLLTYLTMFGC